MKNTYYRKRILFKTTQVLDKISKTGMGISLYFGVIVGLAFVAGLIMMVFRLDKSISWSLLVLILILDLVLWILCGLSAALGVWCEKQLSKHHR